MTLGELLAEGYERVYGVIREGDMIRTFAGISEANDKWIGADCSELGIGIVGVEVWRKPQPVRIDKRTYYHDVNDEFTLDAFTRLFTALDRVGGSVPKKSRLQLHSELVDIARRYYKVEIEFEAFS